MDDSNTMVPGNAGVTATSTENTLSCSSSVRVVRMQDTGTGFCPAAVMVLMTAGVVFVHERKPPAGIPAESLCPFAGISTCVYRRGSPPNACVRLRGSPLVSAGGDPRRRRLVTGPW